MTLIPIEILIKNRSEKPSLPQNDTPEQEKERKEALAKTQKKYILDNNNHLQLPLLKIPLPPEEAFNGKYIVGRGVASLPEVSNTEKAQCVLKSPPTGPSSRAQKGGFRRFPHAAFAPMGE